MLALSPRLCLDSTLRLRSAAIQKCRKLDIIILRKHSSSLSSSISSSILPALRVSNSALHTLNYAFSSSPASPSPIAPSTPGSTPLDVPLSNSASSNPPAKCPFSAFSKVTSSSSSPTVEPVSTPLTSESTLNMDAESSAPSKCPIDRPSKCPIDYTPSATAPAAALPTKGCPVEPTRLSASIKGWWAIYSELSKLRLTSLVVLTTVAGYAMEGGSMVDPVFFWTVVGTTLNSSCANTINQVIEHKNDALMKRTMRRPIPSGRVSASTAWATAFASGTVGTLILATCVNPITAILGATTVWLYTGIYTPLKVRHTFNTWVGAVVGAIPPIMGATAVTGVMTPSGLLLGATLFLWQLPHFMSLAYMCREDYGNAGYKMLPVTNIPKAAAVGLRYSVFMLPIGVIAYALDLTTLPFVYESLIINGGFTYLAYQFFSKQDKESARRLFRGSLLQLPLLLGFMVYHRIDDEKDEKTEGDKKAIVAA